MQQERYLVPLQRLGLHIQVAAQRDGQALEGVARSPLEHDVQNDRLTEEAA